jgi:Domain of unknown function (DUF1707)
MRASDADRDRVVDMLREAVGDGRLTADEFDERLEAALSSRTLGELAVLIADLDRSGPAPARAEDVVRLDQRGGSVQRSGPWAVPRELDLRLAWCDVTLDFTEAVIAHDRLLIDVNMKGGSLTLVTRPGIFVDAGDVVVRYADVDIQPRAEPGAPVLLRVRLSGRMRYGYIGTRQAGPALPPDS